MKRFTSGLAAFATAVLVLAACGSDDDEAEEPSGTEASVVTTAATTAAPADSGEPTTATSGGTSGSNAPATGESVSVYLVTDGDPATGTENTPAKEGLLAGVEALNARGGLLGHEVEVKFCQNPFSTEIAVQCVRDALEDPTAIAFIGNSTNSGEQIDPMILEAGLPIIAGLPLTPTQQVSANEFPIHLGIQMFPAAARLAADNGLNRIMVGAIQAEGTAGIEQLISTLITDTDAEIVGSVPLPITKPDLSAEVTKADTEADAVIMVTDAATMGRFAAAVKQQGADVTLATGRLTAGKKALDAAGADMDGVRVVASILPSQIDAPGNDMFLTDMEAAGMEESAVDEAAINNWLGVQILEQAATAANSVDSAALMTALNEMSDVETFGLTQPIDFTKPPAYFDGAITRVFNPWVQYVTIKDGEYVPDTGEWVNVLEGY